MSDHHDNPADHPHAWIREEVLADIRLDGASVDEAIGLGPGLLRDAAIAYAAAVERQDPQLAAGSPHEHVVTAAATTEVSVLGLRVGVAERRPAAQPTTIAVLNGPGLTLVLVLRCNKLDVIDPGK